VLYRPEKNEPALKAKVDALIEQGIKDGTLNGLSEQVAESAAAGQPRRVSR
jgi:hypothetical protein